MQDLQSAQMTLDVGGDRNELLAGTFKVSGGLGALLELPIGADVRVVVTDPDGEIVSTSLGHVAAVSFKQHRPKDGPRWRERIHTVKVE